ncbi:MAG: hypothetical protein R3C10_07820 [Pirellulales bacterium]
MIKSKKWSLIAAAISTITAGGTGGVAWTTGYFGGGDSEQVSDADTPSGEVQADATAQTDATSQTDDDALAESTDPPVAAPDPFARSGVAPMANSYGNATSAGSYGAGASGGDVSGIPTAAAAFAGIQPVETGPPGEMADVTSAAVEMTESALNELTPPVDAHALGEAADMLPPRDDLLPPHDDVTASSDAYAQPQTGDQYAAQPYGDSYGSGQYTDSGQYAAAAAEPSGAGASTGAYDQYGQQYGDQHAPDGGGAAGAALATGVGAAVGALAANAADADVDVNAASAYGADELAPSEIGGPYENAAAGNSMARDGGNPLRPQYGAAAAPLEPVTRPSAAPAAPLDDVAADTAATNGDVTGPYGGGTYGADAYATNAHGSNAYESSTADTRSDVGQQPSYAAQSYDQQPYGQQPISEQPYDKQPYDEQSYGRSSSGSQYGDVADSTEAPPTAHAFTRPAGASAHESVGVSQPFGDTTAQAARSSEVGVSAESGHGQPGPAQLEGVQQASVSIEKRAPVEAQVGRPAIWEIFVRNTGQVTAHGVEVHDEVPRGATLSRTHPQAQNDGGRIVWSLGSLEPGEERQLEMEIVPEVEGDMGSVARVLVGARVDGPSHGDKAPIADRSGAPEERAGGQPGPTGH